MDEKIVLALDTAEKNYLYVKNIASSKDSKKLADHIVALNTLFESFVYYGFAVSQIANVICELDEDTSLFESLIEPHLRVVDDIEMIARQYASMYVQYIARIAQGSDSKEAVQDLFA
jgi:hypothetical protein